MFNMLSCSNFRNINIENVRFKKINILIGPNNAGKTNFIRALSFCPDMVKYKPTSANSKSFQEEIVRNGWNGLVDRRNRSNPSVTFDLSFSTRQYNLRYKLAFHTGNVPLDFYIEDEILEDQRPTKGHDKPFNYFTCHGMEMGKGRFSTAQKKGKKNSRPSYDVSNLETALLQFKEIFLKNRELYDDNAARSSGLTVVDEVLKNWRGCFHYACSRLNMTQIGALTDSRADGYVLYEDGSNLANVLNQRFLENPYIKDVLTEKMREVIPNLDFWEVPSISNQMFIRAGIGKNTYSANELSDGTIKALLLAVLLFVPPKWASDAGIPEFSCLSIDEPESNLHPAWQALLSRWILSSANYEQCFLSTHSPDFLDGFTDAFTRGDVCVLVFNGVTGEIKECSYDEIEQDLSGWQLGDLYRAGEPSLGGWPW